MSDDKILAIEFGDPENPLAVAAFYDKPYKYGISIHPVLDGAGLKNGDIVPEDKVGDADFCLLFRSKTSVQTIIEELQWIEHAMEINEGENIMEKTRYEQFKEMTLQDMATTLSYCFDCSNCPAKKDGCYQNDAMCIDAIADWLNQSGNF